MRSDKDKERNFTRIVAEACDAVQRYRRLQSSKLSAKAFMKSARRAAGNIKRERILELEEIVARPTTEPDVRRIIMRVGKEISSGHISTIPGSKMDKFMRVYGNENVRAGIAKIEITPAELFCLCVKWAITKHPDQFGDCEDADERLAEIGVLHDKVNAYYDEMRASWTARDVSISNAGSASFIAAPHLTPGGPEWPRELCEYLLRKAAVPEEQIEVPPVTRRVSLTMATEYQS